MEDLKNKYLLYPFLILCGMMTLGVMFYFQGKGGCYDQKCLLAAFYALTNSIIFFGLLFMALALREEKHWLVPLLCLALAATTYASTIDTFLDRKYLPYKFPLMVHLLVSTPITAYLLAYFTRGVQKVPGIFLVAGFLGMAAVSSYHTLAHMTDGGCDGGTCTVVILLVPVYFFLYVLALGGLLLQKSAGWMGRALGLGLSFAALVAALFFAGFTEGGSPTEGSFRPVLYLTPVTTLVFLAAALCQLPDLFFKPAPPDPEDAQTPEMEVV